MRSLVDSRWRVAVLVAACLALVVSFAVGPRAASTTIVISQVYGGGGNSGATYKNDFIELFNVGASPVDVTGWTVQYASSAGSTWQKTTLNGTIQPGHYYLVQEAQGSGGTVSLPTPDASGAIAMSATAGKVALVGDSTTLAGTCPTGLVDFVGFGGANCSETSPTPTLSNTTAALRKGGGVTDTDNNSADFTVGAPTPRNSSCTLSGCMPPTPKAIHDIQGSGPVSPLVGKAVITTGIVTGVKYNGFFIQAPDGEADSNPDTSEGVFVFTSGTPPAAAVVGNDVQVSGTVSEYKSTASDPDGLSMTELTGPTTTLRSTDNPLPNAMVLTEADLNPGASIFALEKYEGMQVHVDSVISTSPTGGSVDEKNATSTSSGIFFGVLPDTARPFREAGIETPLPVPADATPGATPPVFDANPERIGVDTFSVFRDPDTAKIYPPPPGTTLEVTSGVTVTGITGPLDYANRSYIIDAEGWNMPAVSTPNMARQAVRARTNDEFTVATMNLARFYDTVNDPDVSDVVLTKAAFDLRLQKASLAIRNMMQAPDIIGVEEVENLDTLQALADQVEADAIAARQPPVEYAAYLMEGHDPGGIDVGFLVRKGKVSVTGTDQVGKDTLFISDGSFLNDRPSLVLRGAILNPPYEPYPVTVVVNHLRSLSGIDGPGGERVRAKRLAQAVELAGYVQGLQENGEHVVSVGDYNAFDVNDGYVDVMGLLKGTEVGPSLVTLWSPSPVTPPLLDLSDLASTDERYSFVFDGSAQELDHILAANVTPTAIAYARMNADFPESLRGDGSRPERLSDHDPIVGYFVLPDIDTKPPVIDRVTPSVTTLWAPNHAMAPITIAVSATDAVDPTPACGITAVSGDNGATAGDWQVTGPLTLNLRAERLGQGKGRTYTIGVACTDASGNVSLPALTTVFVPHDQRK
ncbi:MAG: lamin tail domain-containing protein [Bacteroidales bacterium]